MAKQRDFDAFLTNIEPSKTTVDYISSVQNNLRNYLEADTSYKNIHIQTFLSGSYAKHTCIRPKIYDGKRDVDIVVETSYDSTADSEEVLAELCDVLKRKTAYATIGKQFA
jgi:tRNA nucleotidyltransferase (CCA-adding enzyme)